MTAPEADAAFRYGRRVVVSQGQTAQPSYTAIPLAPADFLDPQPGDEFSHGEQHASEVARLAATLYARHRLSPFIHVLVGPKLVWADGLRPQPAPDVVLVGEIAEPERPRTILDLVAESVTVRAVFEVTSPLFADLDLTAKRDLYASAGIPEYWVLDTGLRPDRGDLAYTVTGYTLAGDGYVPIAPDPQGGLSSPVARIRIEVTADQRDYVITDTRTGRAVSPAPEGIPGLATRAEAAFRAADIASKLDLRP